jgi:hypothetical protein
MTVAVLDQYSWIIGDNDNATADSCTWDTEKVKRTGQAKESPFMIRIRVDETSSNPTLSKNWQLYGYTSDTPGSATLIDTGTTTAWAQIVGGQPTHGDGTGDIADLTDPTGSFQAGEYSESDETEKLLLAAGDFTDFQFCLQFTTSATGSTTYYFFLRFNDAALGAHTGGGAQVETSAGVQTLTINPAYHDNVQKDLNHPRNRTPVLATAYHKNVQKDLQPTRNTPVNPSDSYLENVQKDLQPLRSVPITPGDSYLNNVQKDIELTISKLLDLSDSYLDNVQKELSLNINASLTPSNAYNSLLNNPRPVLTAGYNLILNDTYHQSLINPRAILARIRSLTANDSYFVILSGRPVLTSVGGASGSLISAGHWIPVHWLPGYWVDNKH